MAVIPDTEVRLLTNVPLNNNYEHQLTFNSINEQTIFFAGKTQETLTEYSYQREEQALAVEFTVDELYLVNYIMYKNKAHSNKWFYGFVTDREYINPNMTRVYFEIDVWQTWQFDIDFKDTFIEREHQNRWNSDGTPVINTVDEGLGYGSDYDVVETTRYRPSGGYKWLVIVSKTSLTNNDIDSNIIATPQPLHYYAIPYMDDDTVPNVTLPNGNGVIIGTPSYILKAVYSAVASQNDIVSVYVTDNIGVAHNYDNANDVIRFDNNGNKISHVVVQDSGSSYGLLQFDYIAQFQGQNQTVREDKYSGFSNVSESKLLMYPYTVLIMTDFKGNMVDFKLEYIDTNSITVHFKGSLGTSNYATININDYNREAGDFNSPNTSIENALISSQPNDVPILNDYLASYLQGNKNSIEAQKNSSIFSGFMGGSSAIMGGVGGAMVGGPAGAAVGAVAGAGFGLTQSLGSTYHQIKSLESKAKDIDNIPPQISKMGSNTAYGYGYGYNGVWFMKKQIKPEYQRKLSDYFKMFGYKIHEVKSPNLKTREHYNFVKTVGANVFGNIPSDEITIIKNMFDSGVTLWHGDWVGDYGLSNGEV